MKLGWYFGLIFFLLAAATPVNRIIAAGDAQPSAPPQTAVSAPANDQLSPPAMLLAQQPLGGAQQPSSGVQQSPSATSQPPARTAQPSTPGMNVPRSPALPQPIAPPAPAPGTDSNALALSNPTNFPRSASLASTTTGYSLASTPNMIGDTLGLQFFFNVESSVGGKRGSASVPIGDQSEKISEDTSPIPTDRVFFDYNFFANALLATDGTTIGLHRYTFGFEKTFFDGSCSIELKAPIDGGLGAIQEVGAPASEGEGTVFGTMALTGKALLYQDSETAIAAGLAIGLPTSPNAELRSTNTVKVVDQSVHLAPYIGFLIAPNDELFSITYLQLDFDANGDPTLENGQFVGRLREPNLLYVDTSIGYWLFNTTQTDYGMRHWLTGMAPMLELHYTTTLQDAEGVDAVIDPIAAHVNILNLTAGLYFQLGPVSSLMVGAVAPLRTSPADKEFDEEILVQFNRRF